MCDLGYNNVPPPFNHNYTNLPLTVEELVNADTMTYGPKTDKTSINSKPVEKRRNQQITFVSKSVNDTNASSFFANEVKVEDVVGNEQASNSDSSNNFINELNPDSCLMHDIFNSFFGSVSSFMPDLLGKIVNSFNNECDISNSIVTETESTNETNEPAEPSDSKCESPEEADSEKLELVDSSKFGSKESCAEPSCANNSSKDSAGVFGFHPINQNSPIQSKLMT
ncbi:hypothetical protein Hanom_Chr06g00531971 [Helianthus anomalus]